MTEQQRDGSELPQPGEVLAGKYRIERLLGHGGMGAVYLAHHEILGQNVALKLLLPEIAANAEAVARFLNEARAAARIRNEHVAQVMDVGKLDNGSAYLVLEYLDGSDLAAVLDERGAVPIADAADYVIQALEAISQAHAQGIIHRDLKPANLFLSKRQDGTPIVKVLDFGISKAQNPLHQAANAAVTSTKALLGSPGYMSPEQVKSSKRVDARSDLWSLGVILYRLLTNLAPFDGETLGEVFASILESDPRPMRESRPEVPEALEAIVRRCLVRDREARFQDCAELAQALAPFAHADAAAAVERISRTLGRPSARAAQAQAQSNGAPAGALLTPLPQAAPVAAPQPAAAVVAAAAPEPPAAGQPVALAQSMPLKEQTDAPWAGSNAPPAAPRRSMGRVVMAAAGVVVVLAVGIVGVSKLKGGDGGAGAAAGPARDTAVGAPVATTAANAVVQPAPSPTPEVAPTQEQQGAAPAALAPAPTAPLASSAVVVAPVPPAPALKPGLPAAPGAAGPKPPTPKPGSPDDSVLLNRR